MINKETFRSFILHAKYGSGRLLLAFDVVMLGLLIRDIRRVQALDLDYATLAAAGKIAENFDFVALSNFLTLIALPVFVALLGNFFIFRFAPERYYRNTTASGTRSWLLVLHMLVIIVCIGHATAIRAIQQASGFCGPLKQRVHCFASGFTWLTDKWLFLLAGTLAMPILTLVLKDTLWKNKELATAFDFWRLIGAVGEYQPAYGDEIIYVNSASMAPSIKSINTATTVLHHRYQRAVPTSDEARNLLFREADDAREILHRYLLEGEARYKKLLNIEFFPGTSRALEAGILRIGNISHVILSQYEHPSQIDVVKWICETQRKLTYTPLLPNSPSFFQERWERQKGEVCQCIEREIKQNDGKRMAIVLSEVHYITGIRIRVGEIIDELRSRYPDLVFIIDGSQAVGNLGDPFGTRLAEKMLQDDFYYFSAHKWLLSPNTCGVLISHTKSPQLQPYDMFGFDRLPTSTIDPNTIFGLASALEFLFGDKRLFERFSEASRKSKAYFRELLVGPSCGLEIVEAATTELNSSLFVAVQPKFGYRWKHDNRTFWKHMRQRGVDLTVVPERSPYFESEQVDERLATEAYLLRISFPYFLIGKNVRKLVGHLNSLVTKAN